MQWIVMDGQWKLAKDGKIATGWQTWDNNRYYLNADGTMKANESFTDGGKTYFFCSWGGAYKNCWQTWNGKKYYLHDNGAAYQNEWLKTGGKWYWFQADSTMAVNTSLHTKITCICGRKRSYAFRMLERRKRSKILYPELGRSLQGYADENFRKDILFPIRL